MEQEKEEKKDKVKQSYNVDFEDDENKGDDEKDIILDDEEEVLSDIADDDEEEFVVDERFPDKRDKEKEKELAAKKERMRLNDLDGKERRKAKREIRKKKITDSLAMKENSWLYKFVSTFVFALDFFLNFGTIIAMCIGIVYAITYLSNGNWIMSLVCCVFIIVIAFINERIR